MTICPICHDDLDAYHELPECSHRFHANCIIQWFRRGRDTCPLCNNRGEHFSSRRTIPVTPTSSYYPAAIRYSKTHARSEIATRVFRLKRSMETLKRLNNDFLKWKSNERSDGCKNMDVVKQHTYFRKRLRYMRRFVYRRKLQVCLLYVQRLELR